MIIKVLSAVDAVDGGTPRSWRNEVAEAIVRALFKSVCYVVGRCVCRDRHGLGITESERPRCSCRCVEMRRLIGLCEMETPHPSKSNV